MSSSIQPANKKSLLESYCSLTHPFFYKNKDIALRSEGVAYKVDAVSMNDPLFSDKLSHSFEAARKQGIEEPYIVGAIPFNRDQKPHLHIPTHVLIDKHSENYFRCEQSAVTGDVVSKEYPLSNQYEQMVQEGVRVIRKGEIEKIVLGRKLQLTTKGEVHPQKILANLANVNEDGFTFAINLSDDEGEQTTLMGASPELLVRKKGQQLSINPLAGSRPRQANFEEDTRIAEELKHSEKDLHEHKLVVDAIVHQLEPICKKVHVPKQPSVIATNTMWHLSTYITAVPNDEYHSASALAKLLHPTPAVCGFSRDVAAEKILEIEPSGRGFFTGLVGWENEAGDGEWAIAIRCAEVRKQQVELFAGAGIVANSSPLEEAEETKAKFQTMLQALECNAEGGRAK